MARVWLVPVNMYRRAALMTAICLGILLLFRPSATAPISPARAEEPTPPAMSVPTAAPVRVQYEFIQIPVPPQTRVARPPQTKAATIRRKPVDASALTRARRAVMGDGRYRPEPFPRIASR